MPSLTITPDMTPEICEGAAGCAWGSQECKGMNPALIPKPTKNKRNSHRFV